MKTTVEIGDSLLKRAKHLAQKEGTTLRNLIESGLRLELDRRQNENDFELEDLRFEGDGIQSGFLEGNWSKIREAIYGND